MPNITFYQSNFIHKNFWTWVSTSNSQTLNLSLKKAEKWDTYILVIKICLQIFNANLV